ncbi:MBL fold metallo-hydrolase, partial [Chloroflexota bacterium]
MSNNDIHPPASDELEISIFGSGYGESILLHIGNNQWIIIDSCLDNRTGRPAALVYLNNIGLDVTNAVKVIVATHWHDDHIKGISAICRECRNAKFVIPGAFKSTDLINLVDFFREKPLASG